MKNISIPMKIWGVLTPSDQYRTLLLLGMMIVGMALEMLGVGLVIPVFALLTQSDFTHKYPIFVSMLDALGNPSQQMLIIGIMLVLVSVYFIKALFLALFAWQQANFAFDMQAQLSYRLFSVYLDQPYTFHLQHNSAQLIRNTLNEVGLFIFNGILPSMMLFSEGLVFFGLCALLLIAEPMGALIVVSSLGLAAWIFNRVTKTRIARWGELRQYHEGFRMQHLQQGLGGVKEVLLFGRQKEFLSLFHSHNLQLAKVGRSQNFVQQLPRLWFEMLAISGLSILVISMLLRGSDIGDIFPMLGLFAAAAFRLMPSVNRLLGAVQSVRYGLPVINVLYRELNRGINNTTDRNNSGLSFQQSLAFDHVVYVYPDTVQPALNDISLVINHGESIGFVGASGAGKSTLVDLFLGLISPNGGGIYVDGRSVSENVRWWQDQIGYVPQSIFLTDDSLRRNIAFGLSNAQVDEASVLRSIRVAQLEEFISTLPDGLDTIVGEHGVRLSGGQRQRIGIARALYHDPAILVLDEATSALDIHTEREVMNSVNALHGKKTILIVAHRLTTIENCDRIYKLQSGKLVENGIPQDVLHKDC